MLGLLYALFDWYIIVTNVANSFDTFVDSTSVETSSSTTTCATDKETQSSAKCRGEGEKQRYDLKRDLSLLKHRNTGRGHV